MEFRNLEFLNLGFNLGDGDTAFTNCSFISSIRTLQAVRAGGGKHLQLYISGCSFTGFNAEYGAALLASAPTEIMINGTTFSHNTALIPGGAILLAGAGSFSCTGCQFSGNSVDDEGGAILVMGSTPVVLERCTFVGHEAGNRGGAVSSTGGSPLTANSCAFFNNSAADIGGALYAENAPIIVTDGYFDANKATNQGGAVFISSNSMQKIGILSIFNCTRCNMTDNQPVRGGAVFGWIDAAVQLDRCNFQGNRASKDGGAVSLQVSSMVARGCVFTHNTAKAEGGAVHLDSSTAALKIRRSPKTMVRTAVPSARHPFCL